MCGCTLLALRSLVVAPVEASADGESQDGQQGVARSAAHAMMRLLSARCQATVPLPEHARSSSHQDSVLHAIWLLLSAMRLSHSPWIV